MNLTPPEFENSVLYQIGALVTFCRAYDVPLIHVKAHGALYNMAANDESIAAAIVRGVARYDRQLVMVGLASSPAMAQAAANEGLAYARGVRRSRLQSGWYAAIAQNSRSPITDPERAAQQAANITRGFVLAHDGTKVQINAQTICLHGDNPAALTDAQAVRQALKVAGVEVKRLR